MTTTLLFGGQGSQKPGMLSDWSSLPEVAAAIEEASYELDEDVSLLDTPEALNGTRAVQLSLLILETAVTRELINRGLTADYLAGHSLGAWSAAVTAGVLSFTEAVRLVDVRARGMAAAAPAGYGMYACTGLPETTVNRLAETLRNHGMEIWVANLNSTDQCSVSGTEDALATFANLAGTEGARKTVRLAVSVPGHCPKMSPAKDALLDASLSIEPARPTVPVMSNISGRLLRSGRAVLNDLIESTDQTVRWSIGMAGIAERGVERWIQVPPGNTLIGLLGNLNLSARSWCVDNVGVDETLAYSRR